MEKKTINRDVALQKLQRYCAYQDRCHQEVRSKLLDLGVYGDTLEEIIVELIGEGFLNEERFARSYARGKFRSKGWGRVRIKLELQARRISAYAIKKGLEEIEEGEYRATLSGLLQKKLLESEGIDDDFTARQKAAQYALRRGYESELIWETLRL
jgi:regulatory protein